MSKVWFITGASRGFGVLMAKDALARGDSVVATARNPQSVIDALGEQPNLLAVRLDVTQEAAAVLAARAAVERFGRIDVLVNNAGYGLLGAVEEASAEEVRALYDTNVFGLLNVTRAVLPQMRRQGSGHVINMSSVGGYTAAAGWGVYGSTKFAVEGISEALAEEVRPLGIHVTVVEPGYFRTGFLEGNSLVSTGAQLGDYAATVGAMRTLAASISLKQPGDPRKLSLAVLQLADTAQPPVRLLLGSDTVRMVREKNRFVEQELGAWIGLSLSTDHDDVQQQAA
ncbi:short-chain dehydrogenase [Massilia sp. Root351]|jgi:NAD(P)-dependent dehydrogenase (short-subunit alcohol dehydrogenase family)|uniref:oxidoreductase n=1 Tax=Massilia sp. Root351 TaxID=1736522 RepID=UPI00070C0B43|nr:oxidoreductase [Massilia sp. Root351]KQV88658.1 short-chain dehydrogenase [Massilia sp. Root351]